MKSIRRINKNNKKTRKQKGGYILNATNPYLIALSVVVGGLYIYGRYFDNKNDVSLVKSQRAGRRKNRTRRTRK